ncbi:hypothetical protein GCM10011506_32360 [Marivirga lumbricoides]|uniref:Uncharacterized protein n=1 Tax=Marivirga lumbricoides TaxID=1046115 RepID=A0ABQ1MPP2_9BACT|nr:hypothetical protein GCM10011506_32360 [Marivirga lumbricoides]
MLEITTPQLFGLIPKKEAIIVERKIKSFKNKATIKNIIEKGWQKAEPGESS